MHILLEISFILLASVIATVLSKKSRNSSYCLPIIRRNHPRTRLAQCRA